MKPAYDTREQRKKVLVAVPTNKYVRVSEIRDRLQVVEPFSRSNVALNVHLISLLHAGLVEVRFATNPKDSSEIVSTYRRRT